MNFSLVGNRAQCFMNSGKIPQLVFEQTGDTLTILNETLYQHLKERSSS